MYKTLFHEDNSIMSLFSLILIKIYKKVLRYSSQPSYQITLPSRFIDNVLRLSFTF